VVSTAQKRSTGGPPTSATASQAADPPYDHGVRRPSGSATEARHCLPVPHVDVDEAVEVEVVEEVTSPHSLGVAAVTGADARSEATERQFVVLAEDDLGASPVTYSGTHDREFLGIPATGEHLEFTSISIVRFADDKISGA
jgi:hypothetical protein